MINPSVGINHFTNRTIGVLHKPDRWHVTDSRPAVDTLKGAKHANIKESHFKANNGAWRVAFAFDTKRQAILLVSGNKSGVNETRFYKELIRKADKRFTEHLIHLK